jgi:hypothetical protein
MKRPIKQITRPWTVRGVTDTRPIPFPEIDRRALDKRADRT